CSDDVLRRSSPEMNARDHVFSEHKHALARKKAHGLRCDLSCLPAYGQHVILFGDPDCRALDIDGVHHPKDIHQVVRLVQPPPLDINSFSYLEKLMHAWLEPLNNVHEVL